MSDNFPTPSEERKNSNTSLSSYKRAHPSSSPNIYPVYSCPPTAIISWGKYHPYTDVPLPLNTPFSPSPSPLTLTIHSQSHRTRFSTLQLPHGPVPLPIFMPVGTKGTIKGMTTEELDELNIPIILGNTYHLACQPTTELIADMGGLHSFMNVGSSRNILTDSGGFQMVSLLKLSEVTEEGVTFANPDNPSDMMLLRPEDSIKHQNRIGADIIMALDDVVSSASADPKRFEEATYRTVRWLDRCVIAHDRKNEQNLFPIVQGGLDVRVDGLRNICLRAFRDRDDEVPGYAIGGLAGGEAKEDFWKTVDFCCRALPDTKPRYLMGVGYPLDIVVCTSLGVDMYDCVYPTRTARFGVALVDGKHPGTLRLKSFECGQQDMVIQEGCCCMACKNGYTRARLHQMLKGVKGQSDPLAVQLMTHHNLAYMMGLMRKIRESIQDGTFPQFVRNFIKMQFPGKPSGGDDVPSWVQDALEAAGIKLDVL